MKTSGIVCPVCGKYTFECEGDYDICEYCGWENDTCTEAGGAAMDNNMIEKARANFVRASEEFGFTFISLCSRI